MRRVILLAAAFLAFSFSLRAQEDMATVLKQINAVKSDVATYLCAESTARKWEDALENARTLLEMKIEEWASKSVEADEIKGCVAKADNSILQLKTKRGDMYRAFLYVRKADISTYTIEVDDKTAAKRQTPKEEVVQVIHVDTEPLNVFARAGSEVKASDAYGPSPLEREMLKVTTFAAVKPYIENNGRIDGYGKYATAPSGGTFYLFVYNREGMVSACLKHTDGGLVNVATGRDDNLNNYKGCGAIWFRLK